MVHAHLRKTSSEYALAVKMRKELWEKIDPIIMSKNQRTLLESDFFILQEYFRHGFTIAAIGQPAFYRQGYLDCVDLLQGLGVL